MIFKCIMKISHLIPQSTGTPTQNYPETNHFSYIAYFVLHYNL